MLFPQLPVPTIPQPRSRGGDGRWRGSCRRNREATKHRTCICNTGMDRRAGHCPWSPTCPTKARPQTKAIGLVRLIGILSPDIVVRLIGILSPDIETEVPDADRTGLLQQAESQLNWTLGGFLGITAGGALLAASAPAWLAGLGYVGSGSTMGGSLAVKAAIGLGSEWGANALTGQDMTFAKGAGAVAGSVIFAPGVGRFLPEGSSLLTLAASGAAAGGGGNGVEQYVDYLAEGKAFSGSSLIWSAGFGALGGALGWANMQVLPTPAYLNPLVNSLHDDIVKLPAAAGAVPALVTQKVIPMPHWLSGH